MILPHPKIFHLHDRKKLEKLLDGPVEITEKLDGSQFRFGTLGGELKFASKKATIHTESPPDLFKPAVDHVISVYDDLEEGYTYYGEAFKKPRHNTLE